MATNSPPTRLDGELYEYARVVAPTMSRSTAQQIAHWARIGREIESSDSVSQRAIGDVLAGAQHYDTLSAHEQAAVRAEWAERIAERREQLDLIGTFEAEGRPYATLDDDGNVVIHNGEGLHLDEAG